MSAKYYIGVNKWVNCRVSFEKYFEKRKKNEINDKNNFKTKYPLRIYQIFHHKGFHILL